MTFVKAHPFLPCSEIAGSAGSVGCQPVRLTNSYPCRLSDGHRGSGRRARGHRPLARGRRGMRGTVSKADDVHWRRAIRCGAIAELTVQVVAEALNAIHGGEQARMLAAGADGVDRDEARHDEG